MKAVAGEIAADARCHVCPGPRDSSFDLQAWVDVRYVGQSHELAVPLDTDWDALRQEFRGLCIGLVLGLPGPGSRSSW